MKHLIPFILLALVAASASTWQVAVQNEEDVAFHFVVVEAGTDRHGTIQRSLQGAADVVATATALTDMVPAHGVMPLPGTRADDLLVGVYVYPGRSSWPVVVVPIAPGARTVLVSRDSVLTAEDGSVVTLRPWQARLGTEPVLLDNRYLDWEPIAPLARFARPIEPSSFRLKTESESRSAAISDALFWGRGGTRLDTVKAVTSDRAVYVKASVHDEFAAGASLLFYFFTDRGVDRSAFTVEIPVTSASGWVLLWRDGVADPLVIGAYVRDAFLMEAMVRFDLVPADLPLFHPRNGAVEVATMFSGAGRHEEFYHARMYLSSVPHHAPAVAR
ncbi:MAG: hypothetical protein EA403_03525 [Spirochaetaceae bacterium]|nr:MAG: hypothetical protein EA403_03525 [Spirochaetaceae bacterium]